MSTDSCGETRARARLAAARSPETSIESGWGVSTFTLASRPGAAENKERQMKIAALAFATLAPSVLGANVYMLSSGDATTDNAAVAALTAHGHTVTIGLPYTAFDGTADLSAFQTVYLQCNANWTS